MLRDDDMRTELEKLEEAFGNLTLKLMVIKAVYRTPETREVFREFQATERRVLRLIREMK